MRRVGRQIRDYFGAVPTQERRLLWVAMALGAAVVLVYIAATDPAELQGDEPEYHYAATLFTDGKLWWSTTPFGVAHESVWKAPGYTAWAGVLYEYMGISPLRLVLVQALLLAPLTVLVTWLLGRHLFGPRTALAGAFGIAIFPLSWEYFGLLYPEALAIPLTTLVLLLVLRRQPTARWALLVGVVIGVTLLVRPTSMFLMVGAGAAWIVIAGWRRGLALTALAVGSAILVIAPWTIRNYFVTDGGFIPISVQDAAVYGTFNEESANDPVNPYQWRFFLQDMPAVLEGPPVDDATLRSELVGEGIDYIREHPLSVPKAIFWNGIYRLWDLRPPSKAIVEVPFEGRAKGVTAIGLGMYYLFLPLAVAALWRLRRSFALTLPVIAMVAATFVIFSVGAGTRYRAPLEPLIVVLAASLVVGRRETNLRYGTTAPD